MALALARGFLRAGPRLSGVFLGPWSRGPFLVAARRGRWHCNFLIVDHTSHSCQICVISLLFRRLLPQGSAPSPQEVQADRPLCVTSPRWVPKGLPQTVRGGPAGRWWRLGLCGHRTSPSSCGKGRSRGLRPGEACQCPPPAPALSPPGWRGQGSGVDSRGVGTEHRLRVAQGRGGPLAHASRVVGWGCVAARGKLRQNEEVSAAVV